MQDGSSGGKREGRIMSGRMTGWALTVVLCCAVATGVARAEEDAPPPGRWDQALALGDRMVAEGRFADADVHFRAALEALGEGGAWPSQRAATLGRLGLLKAQSGAAGAGLPLFEEAVRLRRGLVPPEPEGLAESLHALGSALDATGRSAEALPLLEEALKVLRQVRGRQGRRMLAATWLSLAGAHWALGHAADGDDAAARGMGILESLLGSSSLELSLVMRNLARQYMKSRRFDKAEPLLERALAIRREAAGATSPTQLSALDDLVELHLESGSLERATAEATEAVGLAREALGPDHPGLADALARLAEVRRSAGDPEGASGNARSAIEICRRAYGAAHENTVAMERRFAGLLRDPGAGSILPGVPCPDEVRAMLTQWRDTAGASLAGGRWEEARASFARALTAMERYEDVDALAVPCLYGLGTAHERLGDDRAAARALGSAVDRLDATLGTRRRPPVMGEILNQLVEILGRCGPAEELRRRLDRLLVFQAEAAPSNDARRELVKGWNDEGVAASAATSAARADAFLGAAVAVAGQNGMDDLYVVSLSNAAIHAAGVGRGDEARSLLARASSHLETLAGADGSLRADLVVAQAVVAERSGDEPGVVVELGRQALAAPDFDGTRRRRIRDGWARSALRLARGGAAGAAVLFSHALLEDLRPDEPVETTVAAFVAGTVAASAGDPDGVARWLGKAHEGFLALDGALSPGVVLTETVWLSSAAGAGKAGLEGLRGELQGRESLSPPVSRSGIRGWPRLLAAMGAGAAEREIRQGFDQGLPGTGPMARLAARMILATALMRCGVPLPGSLPSRGDAPR